MLKEFQNKELERTNRIIASYQEDIDELTKQVNEVEEKYRKLAEEETKNLTEVIDYYKEQQQVWKDRLEDFGSAPVKPAKKKAEKKKDKKKDSGKKEEKKQDKYSIAKKYIGKKASALIAAIGKPNKKKKNANCATDGEEYIYYYDGFYVGVLSQDMDSPLIVQNVTKN